MTVGNTQKLDRREKMGKLPGDLSHERFGEVFAERLGEYGFGVLGKADLETLILYSILQSSELFRREDSYGRAEILRVTDQKYRTLIKRMAIWLDEEWRGLDDQALFTEFLAEVIEAYIHAPNQNEIRLVIDDEIRRRNIQRALERASVRSSGIPVEISLTGRSLILRASDLEKMLERVKHSDLLPSDLRMLIKDKEGQDLRLSVLQYAKESAKKIASLLSGVFIEVMTDV